MYEYQAKPRRSGFVPAIFGGIAGAIIALLMLPLFFGTTPADFYERSAKPQTVVVSKQKISKETWNEARRSNPVVTVARKVQPSVVLISTEGKINDDIHKNLVIPSDGSGVIYLQSGYILTNNHVVQDANKIIVKFADGQEASGKIVGRDEDSDLAVVKVNRKNLPSADFGSADDLQVGDLAVAIGSPFGYEGTVTSGVISALHRNVTAPTESGNETLLTDLIQTDAAINPGNSGGALCNQFGQVIGINTLIITGTGDNAGIGFAIPIDLAMKAANQLIKGEKVSHSYLGVYVETLNEGTATRFGVKETKGVIVVGVTPDSAAAKAGIKEKDILIKIDDKPVVSSEELIAYVRRHNVGDKVTLKFIRGGAEQSVEVTLGEKP